MENRHRNSSITAAAVSGTFFEHNNSSASVSMSHGGSREDELKADFFLNNIMRLKTKPNVFPFKIYKEAFILIHSCVWPCAGGQSWLQPAVVLTVDKHVFQPYFKNARIFAKNFANLQSLRKYGTQWVFGDDCHPDSVSQIMDGPF